MTLVVKARFCGDLGNGILAFKEQRFGPVEASVDEVGSQTQAEALFESSVEGVRVVTEVPGELLEARGIVESFVEETGDGVGERIRRFAIVPYDSDAVEKVVQKSSKKCFDSLWGFVFEDEPAEEERMLVKVPSLQNGHLPKRVEILCIRFLLSPSLEAIGGIEMEIVISEGTRA